MLGQRLRFKHGWWVSPLKVGWDPYGLCGACVLLCVSCVCCLVCVDVLVWVGMGELGMGEHARIGKHGGARPPGRINTAQGFNTADHQQTAGRGRAVLGTPLADQAAAGVATSKPAHV